MKFRTDRLDLTEQFGWTTNDGGKLWVDIPVGTTEGLVVALQRLNQPRSVDGNGTFEPQDPNGEIASTMILDEVIDWNLDDKNGKVLPLTSTKKSIEDKIKILNQCPIELIPVLSNKIANRPISEATEGFSRTSSEPSLSTTTSPTP